MTSSPPQSSVTRREVRGSPSPSPTAHTKPAGFQSSLQITTPSFTRFCCFRWPPCPRNLGPSHGAVSRDSECEHTQQATCRLLAAVDATLGQAHVAGRASAARTRLGPLFAELFALGRIRASAPLLPSEPAARPTGSCVPRRTLDAQGTVTDASPRGEEQRRQRPCGLQLSLRGLSDETYPRRRGPEPLRCTPGDCMSCVVPSHTRWG